MSGRLLAQVQEDQFSDRERGKTGRQEKAEEQRIKIEVRREKVKKKREKRRAKLLSA